MDDARFGALAAQLERELPGFRVVAHEDSRLSRILGALAFWNPELLASYTVTIGRVVRMPRRLVGTAEGWRTLRHEAVHARDAARWTLPVFLGSYLLLLPLGLSLRAVWELRGYAETMRVELEETGEIADSTVEWIALMLGGPAYLWSLPGTAAARWAVRCVRDRLLAR